MNETSSWSLADQGFAMGRIKNTVNSLWNRIMGSDFPQLESFYSEEGMGLAASISRILNQKTINVIISIHFVRFYWYENDVRTQKPYYTVDAELGFYVSYNKARWQNNKVSHTSLFTVYEDKNPRLPNYLYFAYNGTERIKSYEDRDAYGLMHFRDDFIEETVGQFLLDLRENLNGTYLYIFDMINASDIQPTSYVQSNNNSGCYIATAVYGSYDCPEVWVLRRYRDYKLSKTFWGRAFIHFYYLSSPWLVKQFGDKKWFVSLWKKWLDRMVLKLKDEGFEDSEYLDRSW